MNKILAATVLCFTVTLFHPVWGQSWENGTSPGIKTSLGVEYFQRTISTGENTENTAQMNTLIFQLGADYQIEDNISLGAFLGYALSGFDQVVFQKLPFSLQVNEENMTGFIGGVRLTAGSLYFSDFEIKGSARFVYFLGQEQNWDIPGLAVEGTATGKSDWMQAAAGPVLYYNGPLVFSPYLALQVNYLWGTFTMEENIANLSGSQEKEIKSKGFLSLSAGGVYNITPELELDAHFGVIPSDGQIDVGAMIRIGYTF